MKRDDATKSDEEIKTLQGEISQISAPLADLAAIEARLEGREKKAEKDATEAEAKLQELMDDKDVDVKKAVLADLTAAAELAAKAVGDFDVDTQIKAAEVAEIAYVKAALTAIQSTLPDDKQGAPANGQTTLIELLGVWGHVKAEVMELGTIDIDGSANLVTGLHETVLAAVGALPADNMLKAATLATLGDAAFAPVDGAYNARNEAEAAYDKLKEKDAVAKNNLKLATEIVDKLQEVDTDLEQAETGFKEEHETAVLNYLRERRVPNKK